jgi:hypothetical protein
LLELQIGLSTNESLKGKQKMKTSILNGWYLYDPNEFFPIWSGDELLNKKQFLRYKLSRLAAKRKTVKKPKATAQPRNLDWSAPFRHWYNNGKHGHWYTNGQ